jgi:putative PIN family toxin of toxin-antitoxin system
VVFDCNVLIQAMSNAEGPAGTSLQLVDASLIELFVSRAVLKELRSVLSYPLVRRKLQFPTDDHVEQFIQRIAFRATLLRRVPHVFNYPRARQDEPYVDLAVAAHADYIVSRDKDLLSLATDYSVLAKQFRQRFPRLSIVNPVEFLRRTAIERGPFS